MTLSATVQQTTNPANSPGLGSVPAASGTAGVTVAEGGAGVRISTFTLRDVSVTMTDATTAGSQGRIQIYDFPAGNLLFLGGSCDLTTARVGTALAANAAVVGAVGTAAVGVDNDTLTSTEADLLPSYAGTLTAGAGVVKSKSVTAGIVVFDGTSTAKDAWLNFAVPDAGSTGNDALLVNGTVTLAWCLLGDN